MWCSKVRKLIWRDLDGRLNESEAALMHGHLERCSSCREEQRAAAAAIGLLDVWPAIEPRLGFEAMLSRIGQTQSKERAREEGFRLPMPGWAAAALALIGIAGGAFFGGVTLPREARQVPSEQQVVSGIDLHAFEDVVAASVVHELGPNGRLSTGEGGSQ